MTEPDGKKIVTHCVINFSRHEDMVEFESEYKKAMEAIKWMLNFTNFL